MINPTQVWSDLNRNARVRGIEQHLTREQAYGLARQLCTYCKHPGRGTNGFNGIDRIDNGLHYTVDNVQTTCKICNKMKGTMTDTEFRTAVHECWSGMQYGERKFWP